MGTVRDLRRVWERMLWRERVLAAVLLVSLVVLGTLSDVFLTADNLLRSTRYAAEIGLLAIPMTMIIITRGVDLSVASTMALSAMTMGLLWQVGVPLRVAVLAGIATGTVAGWLNGWVVARLRVPPIVVTLATLAVYRGIATGLSGGRGIIGFPDTFLFWGSGQVAGIPVQTLMWVAATVAGALILTRTVLGRYIYGIGHNEVAMRFSAVLVDRILLGLYTASGFIAGLTGILYAARVATAKSNAAAGYELAVITAVVLGGTSLAGGEGTVLGTVLGVLIIAVLQNGLTLARVPASVQDVLVGAVLLLAVLSYGTERRGRKEVRVGVPRPADVPSPAAGSPKARS
ncbi:MAG: ABC transporter permease [Armatimonadota bacterium]|nr:ABC transporter permease [Armatimonadota bacterium]